MSWLILTILAIFFRSLVSIASKMLSNSAKISSMSQAVVYTGMATVLSVVISPYFGGISTRGLSKVWLVVLFMVLTQAAGNILFFKGLSELEAGVTAIASSTVLLWGALLSVVFLNSAFSANQVVGIVMLLVAIIIVQYKKGVNRIEPPILYIIGSALMFAAFQVCSADIAKTVSTSTYLILNFGGSTVLVWLMYRRRINRDLRALKLHKVKVAWTGALVALTETAYFIFSYFAYKSAPDGGVVIVLLTSQVIFSVILGMVFLHERGQIKRKLVAGLLALVAGILIKS